MIKAHERKYIVAEMKMLRWPHAEYKMKNEYVRGTLKVVDVGT